MPKLVVSTLITLTLFHFAATAQDTTWFSSIWASTTPDKAIYYRTTQKTDSGWLRTTHLRSGAIKDFALYADDSLKIPKGTFRVYNDKGALIHLTTYVDGKSNGPEVQFNDNGTEMEKGMNKDGQHDGPWTGNYPSGKLAGTVIYVAGKETKVKLYEEDGTQKKEKVFEREAEFPGGKVVYLQYMNKNLHYPDYAAKKNVQGLVIVQFRTTKTGKIMDPVVIRSVEKHVDAEAVRMIREMPDWEPSLVAGNPVESYHQQPVVFKIN